jgi:hypothetical protein
LLFALALTASTLVGCGSSDQTEVGGTDVGNGKTGTASIDLGAFEAGSSPTTKGMALADGSEIDRLLLAIDEVRLRPGTDCEEEDLEIDVNEPLVADLVDGGLLTGARGFPIAPGVFCELRIRFHAVDLNEAPAGTPAEMDGLSLLMEGRRGDGTPFVVRTDVSEHVDLEPLGTAPSFELASQSNPLFAAFDLAGWLAALDLDNLSGASLEVSETDNADRLEPFEDAVKDSVRLFRDEDGDGQLGASEVASGKELAQ